MLTRADAIFLILILFTIYNIESKAENICTTPPPGCFLNCPNGYENFGTENCLCLCKQPSFSATATCFGFVCKSDERCVNVNGRVGCIPVTPVHPFLPSVQSSLQIARPVVPSVINSGVHLGPREQYQSVPSIKEKEKATDSSSLIGECPQIVSGNCDVQCITDSDCPMDAGMRCCPNGCGRECVLAVNVVPFQSHLAIRPLKTGKTIEKEDNNGEELPKTSLEQCEIKCKNSLYQCQLVESDCPNPPCPAVPKCLINPCPTGAPMKMANGVTALCKRQTQCWDGFWCHQIGYHGLGFCCPAPKKVVKVGICPAQQQRGKNEELGNGRENEQKCLAECKSDGDCGLVEKCCFNGCGLSCRRTKLGEGRGNEREEEEEGGNEREFGQTMTPKHGIGTEEQGGDLALIKRPQSANWKGGSQEGIIVGKKSTIKCPILSEKQRNQLDCSAATGTDECKMDSDCSGHLKCCSDGCQMRCIYIPPSQTAEGSHQNGISEESSGSQSPAEERRPAEENLIKMTGGHNGQEEEEFGQNRENGNKIGICPKWGQENRQQFCDGRKKWAEEEEDECQNDLDCGGLQKCCLDGCGSRRICQFPSISSECLSQRMAAEILSKFSKHNRNRGFKPKCDSEGHFLPIQRSSDGFNWCVDSRGMELPGTRLPNSHFNGCEQRKICPFIECPLKCPFGHQMDGIGCPQCICKDSPCRGIQCPESNVCRMAERKCLNLDGNGQNDGQSKSNIVNCLIPECVLNICLQGDPLEDTETGAMLRCDEERGRKCPPGYYCHKLGIGDAGYCCAGLVLQSELWPSASKCPSMPNLAYKRKKKKKTENEDGQIRFGSIKQAIGCRFSRECGEGNGKICCFNGWATECTKIGGRNEEGKVETMDNDEERADEKRENQRIKTATMTTNMPDDDSPRISAGDFGTTETFERNDGIAKIASGPCPSYLRNVSNPGCTNNCQNDADCAKRNGQMRCCQVGCGQQCHFPERLSPCVHLLATTFREVDKLAKMPETLGRPTVQCTPEGLFHPIQFDAISGQYWCVDQLNGIEQPGTRISSSPVGSALPDCSIRHQCKIECPKEKMERCEHGLRLDHRGCPTDERCECRNSCDDFKCSLPDSEICILKSVKCVMAPIEGKTNNVACPSVPICVPNVCRQQTPKMELANKKACLSDSECIGNGNTAECRPINDPIERIGLCCQHEERQLEQPLIDPTSSLNEPAIINGGIQPHHHSHSHTVETRQGICPARIISGNEGMANECLDECKKDSQCAGIQKCCPMEGGGCSRCVQPLLATNCQNLLSTLQSMDSARIHHFLPPPICDRRGTFERIQCDGQAFCWCVDSQMGRPILGTRKLQPIGDFCSDRKTCPIFCPQRRLLECPFGVEMDLDGCPLTSECRCRTLCEQVRCPEGEICLLSARDCQEREQNEEAICLPMPTCQRSPCGGLLQPALGPNSKLPLHCFLTNGAETQLADQLCPNGFRCVRPIHHLYGQKQQPQDGAQGICCPLDEEEEATMEMRENGQNNQVDFIILGTNPCFLAMNQGRAEGCDRKMELRFFHDFSQQSCEEFVFSGCGGNSNNFRSRAECEQQCLGGTQKQQDEKEMFSMGFTLIPPQGHKIEGGRMDEDRSEFDRRELESSLRSYLRENFNLDNTQIRDVHFGPIDGTNNNSNHIQFSILAKDARRKAKSISDAFASGQFQFPHQNQLFRAQPDTWFARQIPLTSSIEGSENSDKNAKSALFWVILTASIFFSLVVLMVLCCGYAFLYERSHSQSSGGSVCFSPSPQIGAIHHHWSPLPNRKNADPLSTEEIHRMRANAAGGGGGQLLTPMPSSTSTASASTHLPVQQTTIIAPKIISEDEARMGERRRGGGINQTAKTTLYY